MSDTFFFIQQKLEEKDVFLLWEGLIRLIFPIFKFKNQSFQIESLDSGQNNGFLDFLGFFFVFF